MSSTVESAVEIRPFSVEVGEEQLEDLRRSITAIFTNQLRAAFRTLR
jgi:hypothetical protein